MPVIYPTGQMRSDGFSPCFKYRKEVLSDIAGVKDDLEVELKKVFANLFNPDIDFVQTENEDNCKYCPFKDYCNR